jgi:hypothetical protein
MKVWQPAVSQGTHHFAFYAKRGRSDFNLQRYKAPRGMVLRFPPLQRVGHPESSLHRQTLNSGRPPFVSNSSFWMPRRVALRQSQKRYLPTTL